jgi:excisionase family DNA binding protein
MSLRIQAVVPPPDVYSIDGFGRAFGFGRSFIYEEIGAGRLRAVKAGRKTLIRRTDALAYIDSLPPITELGPHEPEPAQAPEDRFIPNQTPVRYREKLKRRRVQTALPPVDCE